MTGSVDVVDALSSCDGFNNHHIGTLRCRQEGAFTPSTEAQMLVSALKLVISTTAQDRMAVRITLSLEMQFKRLPGA